MRIFLIVSLLSFTAYYWLSKPTPLSISSLKLETALNNGEKKLCENKSGCIGIYIAPWCSACHSSIPLINQLINAKNADDLNFIVVIGSDDTGNLRQFAREIDGDVYIDSKDRFRQLTRYSSVPRWFVINDKQEITDNFTLWYIPDGTAEEKVTYLKQNYG